MKIFIRSRARAIRLAATVCVGALLIGIGAYRASRVVTDPAWTGRAMGAPYTIKLAGSRLSNHELDKMRQAIEARMEELNRQMSTYRPDSEISRFNACASTQSMTISDVFADVCRVALRVSEQSGGAFDPTVNDLVNLWGFGNEDRPPRVPSSAEIADAMTCTGYRHIVLENNSLRKDAPGVQLDLGALGPGRGADEMAAVIRAFGVTNFLVELGGEIVASGNKGNGRRWRIGIDRPEYDAPPGTELEAIVELSDRALATSGDYRNYFRDDDGHYYVHIFDPRTGRPVRGQTASVTVIAADGMTADALSTTLFVLGPEQGAALLTNYPGSFALFILRNPDGTFREIRTAGFPSEISP